VLSFSFDRSVVFLLTVVLSFSFDHSVVTTLWSKEKNNTMVKRKRLHCRQNKKTTLWSKEKENPMVKRKRQHYGKKKDNTMVLSFSFDHSVVFSF
jgi:hypothetical protein